MEDALLEVYENFLKINKNCLRNKNILDRNCQD